MFLFLLLLLMVVNPNFETKDKQFEKHARASKRTGRHNIYIGVIFFFLHVSVVNNSKNSLKSFGRHIGCFYLCTISFHRRRNQQINTHTRTFESLFLFLPSLYHTLTRFRLIITSLYAEGTRARWWAKHISIVKPFLHACKYFPDFSICHFMLNHHAYVCHTHAGCKNNSYTQTKEQRRRAKKRKYKRCSSTRWCIYSASESSVQYPNANRCYAIKRDFQFRHISNLKTDLAWSVRSACERNYERTQGICGTEADCTIIITNAAYSESELVVGFGLFCEKNERTNDHGWNEEKRRTRKSATNEREREVGCVCA